MGVITRDTSYKEDWNTITSFSNVKIPVCQQKRQAYLQRLQEIEKVLGN